MRKNKNLHSARKAKNDNFITKLFDIEREMKFYKNKFKGKVVYCNCGDGTDSNFYRYFSLNYDFFGLKGLICTDYKPGERATKYFFDGKTLTKTQLNSDGSYDSEECLALLDESDIVVTNPPFHRFIDYIGILFAHNKDFIVIGNTNAITYKEIFPLIMGNKMWWGVSPRNMFFDVPGGGTASVNAVWYTNIVHDKRQEKIILVKEYDAKKYFKYDNYDAIDIPKVSDIPYDYDGVMGVPITFLSKFNPEQFEIVDSRDYMRNGFNEDNLGMVKNTWGAIHGHPTYARILIKNRNPRKPANVKKSSKVFFNMFPEEN